MCLAIPGKIISIDKSSDELIMGKVDFGGISRDVCLDFVPEAVPGDYVIVHVGFALSVMNEAEARQSLEIISEVLQYEKDK